MVELVVAVEERGVGEDAAPVLVDEGGAHDLCGLLKLRDEDELTAGRKVAAVSLTAMPAEPDAAAEEDQAELGVADGQAVERCRQLCGCGARRGGFHATQSRSGRWSSWSKMAPFDRER
jgi:hypothetical protein